MVKQVILGRQANDYCYQACMFSSTKPQKCFPSSKTPSIRMISMPNKSRPIYLVASYHTKIASLQMIFFSHFQGQGQKTLILHFSDNIQYTKAWQNNAQCKLLYGEGILNVIQTLSSFALLMFIIIIKIFN